MNCIHCKTPNPEQWFYCRSCGNKASESIYTTNLFMQSEIGKRSDIEFSTMSMDDHIGKISRDRSKKESKIWADRIKQAGAN
jgi:hypothetical protein